MTRNELIGRVKRAIQPKSNSLFMFTDPTYVYEHEWDEEMQSAKPFGTAIREFLDCMSDFEGKSEFTDEECDHMIFCMETCHVTKGQKFND